MQDEPITEAEQPPSKYDSKIRYKTLVIAIGGEAKGLVPEYEEREAAAFASVGWPTFESLSENERASIIAHYRMHNLIESHASYHIHRQAELESMTRDRG